MNEQISKVHNSTKQCHSDVSHMESRKLHTSRMTLMTQFLIHSVAKSSKKTREYSKIAFVDYFQIVS